MEFAMASSEFLTDRSRRGCNAATCAFYAKLLRWLGEFLDERGVSAVEAVTTRLLEDYVADLRARPISGVTVRKRVLSIKTFWLWCAGRGFVRINPAQALPTPRSPQRLPKALSPTQARLLLAAPMSPRDRAVIALMLDTGIRVAECAALDVRDLDSEQRTLLVRMGKGGKQRMVVFADETREALRLWHEERNRLLRSPFAEQALFLTEANSGKTKAGSRVSCHALYKAVKRIARNAGLYDETSPHKLRHTCFTTLVNAGMPLTSVAKLAGHEKVTTTEIYTRVGVEDLREQHDRFSPMKRLTR